MSSIGEIAKLSADDNGNGKSAKMLWWIVNVLLGLATTSLWLGYFDIQAKIESLNVRLTKLEELAADRGERITKNEGLLDRLADRVARLEGSKKWNSAF